MKYFPYQIVFRFDLNNKNVCLCRGEVDNYTRPIVFFSTSFFFAGKCIGCMLYFEMNNDALSIHQNNIPRKLNEKEQYKRKNENALNDPS